MYELMVANAKAYMSCPSAFWLEEDFHTWFQRPVPFRLAGSCPHCGEKPCGWDCASYLAENGVDIDDL